ncbi:DoxX family protein [Chitinophaga silvatica]|uniref:DoxX family protein n=1 Tax=Chitinophaga silvatica TaxID=2282649 RepID=A0A3E1Y490_9BACT|nr:DoxX family protein [Chitinophaga silvatica]RFS19540.1 DoxX family protein [Chitinophaga silvatica]
MNTLQRIEHWGDTHHPNWLSAIRILLGIFLMAVGIKFVMDRNALIAVINQNPGLAALSVMLGHYVVFAHCVGGLFIAMGLFTRLAALLNIPVLIGAVFFVHSPTGLFSEYQLLGLSILVLALLILFVIEGSGRISVDEYMRRHPGREFRDKYIDF